MGVSKGNTEAAQVFRTKHFMTNRLLNRKQCAVEISHVGAKGPSKAEITVHSF